MIGVISRFVREDRGQDLIEYSLLAAFIALACIAAITALGTQINATYNAIGGQIGTAAAGVGS